jgi:hypothetical protein
MDFVLIQGSTPEEIEENNFLWGVNLSAKVERLRDFIGLESTNLMRIVAQAADFMKAKLTSTKTANVTFVQEWLATNVNWGALRCPDIQTVERHLFNWGHIQKHANALEVFEAAVQRWGRNNLLDWPTKVGVIVSKTDASSLGYVVEALYAQMWRKNTADPYGVSELKKVVSEILWVRTYVLNCRRQYPEVLKNRCEATLVAQRFLDSPLHFHEDGKPRSRPDMGATAPDCGSALFHEARAGVVSGALSA